MSWLFGLTLRHASNVARSRKVFHRKGEKAPVTLLCFISDLLRRLRPQNAEGGVKRSSDAEEAGDLLTRVAVGLSQSCLMVWHARCKKLKARFGWNLLVKSVVGGKLSGRGRERGREGRERGGKAGERGV